MEKKYYFLAGLPRSGNTLLSSILNQNPSIYSSPLSPTLGILLSLDEMVINHQHIKRSDDENINNFIKNILKNYYKDIDKPIIIDREKVWGTSGNFSLIKQYIDPNPKVIFTVRPIIEILTSFISILPENSYLDQEMLEFGFLSKDYLTKNDNRCDYLMKPFGIIDRCLFSINEIMKLENKENFCVVQYDEIINNPQVLMKKIYKFLEMPEYEHDFNNIIKLEKDNDEEIGQPKNMHEIRKKLEKNSREPKDVLSDYVINKYSNMGWDKI